MRSKKLNPKPKPKASPPLAVSEWSFEAIGTRWWIGVFQPVSGARLAALQRDIAARIEQFDKTYSRFRSDSVVTAIAGRAGSYDLPPDSVPLLAFYRQLYDLSEGAVTPLIGQTLADAGYDAAYSLQSGELQVPPVWDDVMSHHDTKLTVSKPILLDFGAAGKGYLVDIISDVLQQAGISRFCVDAGGDMFCQGLEAPLVVGLENPADSTEVIGTVQLLGGALCGSAGNRRAWGDYHHIIDPFKLTSPRHIAAVWVRADDAMTADGLATALFFVAAAVLRRVFSFEYLLVYADGSIERSEAFEAELFTNDKAAHA